MKPHLMVRQLIRPLVPAPIRRQLRRLWPAIGTMPPRDFQPWPGYPNTATWIWRDAQLWQRALARSRRGPCVVLGTSMGGFAAATLLESVLGLALTLRGARVNYLLCDKALPACLQSHVFTEPQLDLLERDSLLERLCANCHPVGAHNYHGLGLPVLRYGQFLTPADQAWARDLATQLSADQIRTYRHDGMALGEHALAGTLRFFARGTLEGQQDGEKALRRYFEAALLAAKAMQVLLAAQHVDATVLHHGIYIPQGVLAEACRVRQVPVVTWNVTYRKNCFIFSHDDTYHHTMLTEPTANWEYMPWTAALERELLDYLASRLTGARDWVWFHEKPFEDIDKIGQECGVDFSKPCIGLLTNVFWDAQLHYRANAFANMLDWLVQTIRYFAHRPDLQLLIRIHPAEIRGTMPSRQPLLAEIQQAFPRLPKNVFVIGPESNCSTYAAMYKCDSVIIYGTKTGVELTSVGIPVVVAGEAWIRGKGVTMDANSPEEYFQLLERLPLRRRLEGRILERARKYAYHFFFRRMIPLPFMTANGAVGPYDVDIQGLTDLQPGRHPGLDAICDGILHQRPFLYPAERLVPTAATVG